MRVKVSFVRVVDAMGDVWGLRGISIGDRV